MCGLAAPGATRPGQVTAEEGRDGTADVSWSAGAHTLRHTFASFYLRETPGDLIGLAMLLGHSSLDTTRIYGQPTVEQLASRVDRSSLNAYAK